MKDQAIARRYARALIKVAQGSSKLEEFGEQIDAFARLCEKNRVLGSALADRALDAGSRENVVRDLQKKIGFDVLIGNFLCILIRKARVSVLRGIADEYNRQANEILGRENMTVSSPQPLADAQYQILVDHFSKKIGRVMLLKKETNAELLGGVKVMIGNRVYDYTIKSQLEHMKAKLLAH